MFDDRLKEMELISKSVGDLPEYVQGGGGNTSVKIDDRLMAVKASGYRLNQVTPGDGFALVNYAEIIKYFETVAPSSGIDLEKDSVEFVKKNTVEIEGFKTLRPSIETGFHSILKTYVIHTHPVYANMLCCAANGKDLAAEIFGAKDYNYLWIPFIKPGFNLTLKIWAEIQNTLEQGKEFPAVIFMENHGLIVTAADSEKCIGLHQEVNDTVKTAFSITDTYPQIKLERIDDSAFRSQTGYLTGFFKDSGLTGSFFDTVLYPDQLVYLNESVSVNSGGNKLNINTATGELLYKANYAEALAIEETLLAFLYVVNTMKSKGLTIKTMGSEETDFIKNWEVEKYRRSLIK